MCQHTRIAHRWINTNTQVQKNKNTHARAYITTNILTNHTFTPHNTASPQTKEPHNLHVSQHTYITAHNTTQPTSHHTIQQLNTKKVPKRDQDKKPDQERLSQNPPRCCSGETPEPGRACNGAKHKGYSQAKEKVKPRNHEGSKLWSSHPSSGTSTRPPSVWMMKRSCKSSFTVQ